MMFPTTDMAHMDELHIIKELTGRQTAVIGDWYPPPPLPLPPPYNI